MCSFDVHYVDVAKKNRAIGGQILAKMAILAPLFVCLFVLADGRGIQIETVPPNKVGIH